MYWHSLLSFSRAECFKAAGANGTTHDARDVLAEGEDCSCHSGGYAHIPTCASGVLWRPCIGIRMPFASRGSWCSSPFTWSSP
jgi:hypothetical protein